jgi:ABC-type uncharacterized transport system involved in gliding motility auxiliary subunit
MRWIKRLSLPLLALLLFALPLGLLLKLSAFSWLLRGISLAGLILLIISGLLEWPKLEKKLLAKKVFPGVSLGVMIISLAGILVIVNIIASRHHARIDLTLYKIFSLSPQTKRILSDLKNDIYITCFSPSDSPTRRVIKNFLDEYAYYCKRLKITYVDPYLEPQKAIRYKIEKDDTIVFECGERREDITTWGEEDITSAIYKVMQREKQKVYFLTGHGERDPESEEIVLGASYIKSLLEKENYEVDKLDFYKEAAIPQDCDIIVIAGPQRDLMDKEKELLKKFISEGGKLLILVDPPPAPGLADLTENWGLRAREDIVIDPGRNLLGEVQVPCVTEYKEHKITNEFRRRGNIATWFPYARSITPTWKGGFTYNELFCSSKKSWGETEAENINLDKEKDTKGPLTLAGAVKKEITRDGKKKIARVVLIGDSDFMTDRCIKIFNMRSNADVFMNAINWLGGVEELISIRAKDITAKRVNLSNKQILWIRITSIFGLPGVILLLGGVVWLRRRG